MVCVKCHGTGWFNYDDNHATVCNACCTHDKGRWLLTHQYAGYKKGHFCLCCLNGCGHVIYINKLDGAEQVRVMGT